MPKNVRASVKTYAERRELDLTGFLNERTGR